MTGLATDRQIYPFRIEPICSAIIIDLHSRHMAIKALLVERSPEVCPVERVIGRELSLSYGGEIDPLFTGDMIIDRQHLYPSVWQDGQVVLHMFGPEGKCHRVIIQGTISIAGL